MENNDRLAKGIGLVTFGLLWMISGDFLKSALIALGVYLIVQALGDRQ
ncbi:hypothetical protein EYM_00965 [Ignicoccus islandicus DSM 13165]|uniref:Uncharacterized protein n=1 Tax=Ignicoccus islandicus DSM 13165 TaxID=940295 RepID=A0A0U3FPA6_9CREN|nr:hypothetical protein [Ignicoccus islandicus]ALU12159.1 hypothetical protein EYM_00965 [Ignicoccus islandicus DSM 13165]